MKEIPLTQGKVALVDDEDYERLIVHKWHATRMRNVFYAVRHDNCNPARRLIYMHHEIIGKPGLGFKADHVNNDSLANLKGNLRIVTDSQSNMNRRSYTGISRFKGVHWRKVDKKWKAQIQIDGTQKHLGYFISEEAAARAYDAAATELFGEYARLNFPN